MDLKLRRFDDFGKTQPLLDHTVNEVVLIEHKDSPEHICVSRLLSFCFAALAKEPDEHHHRPETGVDRGENPRLGLVEQDLV